MTTENNYVEGQLYKACPVSPEKVESRKLQLRTELGTTNWLELTAVQWRQIESILRSK